MAEQSEVPVAEVGVEAAAREPAGGGATAHPAFAPIAAGGARRPPVADLGNVGEISEVLLSLQRTAGNRAVTRGPWPGCGRRWPSTATPPTRTRSSA